MKRFIAVLITISFALACLSGIAGAALSPYETELITVTAVQDSSGNFLMYRVFAKQSTPLPASVQLKLEPGERPTDVQESNGLEWWRASHVQNGDTLTVNLTKGRIAEVHVSAPKIFENKADGTTVAVVPLSAQKGVANVQAGATRPEGTVCLSPSPVELNSDFSTALLVVSVFSDMTKSDAPTEVTFVFGLEDTVYSEAEIADDKQPVEREPGQCCWWPLVVLCVLFLILGIFYLYIKARVEEDETPPADPDATDDDVVAEIVEDDVIVEAAEETAE
jgi:hypothetical protein